MFVNAGSVQSNEVDQIDFRLREGVDVRVQQARHIRYRRNEVRYHHYIMVVS